MVKEIHPITFVRDLRDGLKKNFTTSVEPVKPPVLPDDEGEALDPVDGLEPEIADDVAGSAQATRRKRIARD